MCTYHFTEMTLIEIAPPDDDANDETNQRPARKTHGYFLMAVDYVPDGDIGVCGVSGPIS